MTFDFSPTGITDFPVQMVSGAVYILPFPKQANLTKILFFLAWRGWKARRNFQRILEAVEVIQYHTRRYLTLKRFEEQHLVELNAENSTDEFNNETIPEEEPVLRGSSRLSSQTPLITLSFSPEETAKRNALSSFVSRTVGSWFDPLEMSSEELKPQIFFSALCNKQMTFNLTRGNISPLAVLMGKFGTAKTHPQARTAGKQSSRLQTVNRRSAIISRRDIEKVTVLTVK